MSWRDGARAGFLTGLILFAGCGFHPLYGSQTVAVPASLEKSLASIRVNRMPDRQGQIMTNQLTDALNPHALTVEALYRLDVKLLVNLQNYDIRPDSTTGRSETTASATWSLIRLSDNAPLISGRSKALAGHDISTQEYANVSSGAADSDHAIAEVADDIEARLVIYFQDAAQS